MTLKDLSELEWKYQCSKTQMRPDYVPKTKFTDQNTNGLTKCVMTFLQLHGCQCERVANMGMYIPPKEYKDVAGFTRFIGKGKWRKGSGTNGTSDVHSTVPIKINGITVGISVKWEIKCKVTKDKVSDKQIDYKQTVTDSGGFVYFVPDFETFYKHWVVLHKQFVEELNKV